MPKGMANLKEKCIKTGKEGKWKRELSSRENSPRKNTKKMK